MPNKLKEIEEKIEELEKEIIHPDQEMVKKEIHIIKKFILFAIGVLLLGLGIDLIYLANLGYAAWDGLNYNISYVTGLSVGMIIFIEGIVIVTLISIVQKKRFDFYSIIVGLLLGQAVDFWANWLIPIIPTPENLIGQSLIFIVGFFTLTSGVALYIIPNMAVGPIDKVMLFIHETFKTTLAKGKMYGEVFAVSLSIIIAFFIGNGFGNGVVGIGTILTTFGFGITIQKLNIIYKKLLKIK